MNPLRVIDLFGKRQREQRAHLLARPIVADGAERARPVISHGKRHGRTMASGKRKSKQAMSSSQDRGQFGKIGRDEIGLMRRVAERPLAPVDERGAHAV